MDKIIVYTDGSANVKSRLGGFGVYMKINESEERFFNKGFSNTKTGRMELMAVITALNKIKDKTSRVTIISDSQYVVKCITENRLWSWERNLWQGLKNVDLLVRFLSEYRKFKYQPIFRHIKGHQDVVDEHTLGNNIADSLANYKNFKDFIEDVRS